MIEFQCNYLVPAKNSEVQKYNIGNFISEHLISKMAYYISRCYILYLEKETMP